MKGTKKKKTNAEAGINLQTPIGVLHIAATPRGISQLDFVRPKQNGTGSQRGRATSPGRQARTHIARAIRQIREYFSGRRTEFDLPLDLEGTPNQQLVWQGLLEIPYGKTLTYGDLAHKVGSPRAARAVGSACGRNPVAVIVPCHRVIGTDGSLHGYGGGLWRKEFLLKLEGVLPAANGSSQQARLF